jgi:ubiquinone/menaquinone biosynthesis C-methylase UbiE
MSNETQRQIWSEGARIRKDVMDRYLIPLWTGLLDATGTAKGTSLLDAGCGSGELGIIALARGSDVTGVDIAPQMIELCRADPKLAGAKYFEGSIEEMPFKDNEFDAAIASMSVHFCDDVPRAIRDLHRVLKPGGTVGISAPLGMELDVLMAFHLAIELVEQKYRGDIGRPLTFAPDGKLAAALETAGFKQVTERTIDTPLVAESFEQLWHIQKTWAPIQLAANLVGEAQFLAAYQKQLQQRLGTATPSRLEMKYRVVTGVKP